MGEKIDSTYSIINGVYSSYSAGDTHDRNYASYGKCNVVVSNDGMAPGNVTVVVVVSYLMVIVFFNVQGHLFISYAYFRGKSSITSITPTLHCTLLFSWLALLWSFH